MKYIWISVILLAVFAASSVDVRAQAADPRADSGPFGNIRLGVSSYGGDRDADNGTSVFKPQFGDAGFALGIEAGMILSRSFSLSIGYQFADYPRLNENTIQTEGGNNLFPILDESSSTSRGTVPLLLRWMILPSGSFSPYLNVGGNVTLGSYKPLQGSKSSQVAFGPSFGLGFDFVVTRNNSIFLETTYHMTFDDFKVDAGETTLAEIQPLGADAPSSNSSFDILSFWGIGIRHSINPACGPPTINSVQVPGRVDLGEPAALTLVINEEACDPVDVSWDVDGEATATGLGTSYMFSTPGTHTVNVTATNSAGSATATATVEVIDPCPIAASIIAINLNPSDPIINETITFTADVRGTAPLTYAWDFGDGSKGTGARAAHMYSEPGEYTVSLTCSNCGGSDSRSITIVVREFRCDDLTELNSVFFSRNSAGLNDDAEALLGENVNVLNECTDKLVRIDAYADRGERGPQSLSDRRGTAVEQFYIDAGIPASRVMSRGLGRDPLAGKGVDGQRNRRADSIILDSFE
ncbi:MAG: PKD domain-containing protein [Rhodothermia bacterium]